jgi:hypothetical protein
MIRVSKEEFKATLLHFLVGDNLPFLIGHIRLQPVKAKSSVSMKGSEKEPLDLIVRHCPSSFQHFSGYVFAIEQESRTVNMCNLFSSRYGMHTRGRKKTKYTIRPY